jgi:hypothetical protein
MRAQRDLPDQFAMKLVAESFSLGCRHQIGAMFADQVRLVQRQQLTLPPIHAPDDALAVHLQVPNGRAVE